jgi:hypothetical protein
LIKGAFVLLEASVEENYQTTAIAIELTDRATIASHALFGKTCFFAFK